MISRPLKPGQRSRRRHIAIRGIPVRISRGWAALVIALALISADVAAPEGSRHVQPYVLGAMVLVGAVASLILHDLAHDLVSRRRGARLHAIVLASFGALTDEAYPPERPEDDTRVAVAGPLASALLGLIFGFGWWLAPAASAVDDVLGTLALVNAVLAVLTLLPGYPMDGGRVLRAFIWYLTDDLIAATKAVALYGQIIGFGVILAGLLILAVGGTWSVAAAWLLLAYWSVSQIAREGFIRTLIREGGRRVTADEAGLTTSRRIAADRTIDAALDEILQSLTTGPLLVQHDGHVVGIVSLQEIQRVPRVRWDVVTVGDVAAPLDDIPRTDAGAALVDILDLVDASSGDVALIVAGDRIVGAADRKLIYARIRAYLRMSRVDIKRRNTS